MLSLRNSRWQLQAWAAWLAEGILDVAVPMRTRPIQRGLVVANEVEIEVNGEFIMEQM